MSRPESSISLAEFRKKHGVSNPTCHRHIRKGWLKTVRAANGRQRVTTSQEAVWLGLPKQITRPAARQSTDE